MGGGGGPGLLYLITMRGYFETCISAAIAASHVPGMQQDFVLTHPAWKEVTDSSRIPRGKCLKDGGAEGEEGKDLVSI